MKAYTVEFSDEQAAVLMSYCMMLEHKNIEEFLRAAVLVYLVDASEDVGGMFLGLEEACK